MAKLNDDDFFHNCDKRRKYARLDEYKADVKRWLTLSSWHYTEEQAEDIINQRIRDVEQSFKSKECVSDCGAEIGFFCG